MNINAVFPLTGNVVRGESASLVRVIVFYLLVCAAARVLDWLLGWVPVLGWLLRIVFYLAGVYCVVGIVLALLRYFGSAD